MTTKLLANGLFPGRLWFYRRLKIYVWAALGTVSVCQLHAEELPPLEELDPAQCYLSWTIELASSCAEEELHEVFEFVEHLAEVTVQRVDQPSQVKQRIDRDSWFRFISEAIADLRAQHPVGYRYLRTSGKSDNKNYRVYSP